MARPPLVTYKPKIDTATTKPAHPDRPPSRRSDPDKGRPADTGRSRSPIRRKQPVGHRDISEAQSSQSRSSISWHPYKYGCSNVAAELWDDRPRCLLLFSGRPRENDIASFLQSAGWIVVVVDVVGPIKTDLLQEDVRKAILSDVNNKVYDTVGLATPSETVSPLRETPPGPRPLRSLEFPDGLPRKVKLSSEEKQQLADANIKFEFSAQVIAEQLKVRRPFWLENPDHKEKLDLWKIPCIKKVIGNALVEKYRLDQCRFGAETTKPTIFAAFDLDLSDLRNKRCDHPIREFKRPDGTTYKAAHESLVQRWRTREDGHRERASKALGEYPANLCQRIALATALVPTHRASKLWKLRSQPIP